MESSREGVPKKLNGHGGLNGQGVEASDSGASQAQLGGLVEELARAMNMARDSLERPQASAPASTTGSTHPLPAMPAPRGLFDDEDDDATMPIPSTWRTPPEPPRSGTFRDQARAAAVGFATGLAIVVPIVLFMTGRLGDLKFDAIFGSDSGEGSVVRSASAPTTVPLQVQQRAVSTTIVLPKEAPAIVSAAAVPQTNEPALDLPTEPAKPSWTEVIAEGKERILAGDIIGGRKILAPAVEAEEPDAIMSMAETYDPNMLAAWGVRDVAADVTRARELYERAVRAGVRPAEARLNALN